MFYLSKVYCGPSGWKWPSKSDILIYTLGEVNVINYIHTLFNVVKIPGTF